jgi:hypothetical protein
MSNELIIKKSKRAKSKRAYFILIGIKYTYTLRFGSRIVRAAKTPYIAPLAPIIELGDILKMGWLKRLYPIADSIPEAKKTLRNCLFPIILSSVVPKKNRTNILKKRCHKPLCRKMYVTSVQGLVIMELGSNSKALK